MLGFCLVLWLFVGSMTAKRPSFNLPPGPVHRCSDGTGNTTLRNESDTTTIGVVMTTMDLVNISVVPVPTELVKSHTL